MCISVVRGIVVVGAALVALGTTRKAYAGTEPRDTSVLLDHSATHVLVPIEPDQRAVPTRSSNRVTVQVHDARLQDVLDAIALQAQVRLLYSVDEVPIERRISLSVTDVGVMDALSRALEHTRIAAHVTVGGQIALDAARDRHRRPDSHAVVTGRVIDARNGDRVSGASVRLEGSRFATLTDSSGGFRFVGVPAGQYVISTRRVGFARAERQIAVGDTGVVQVTFALEVTPNVLDQVIVTGTVAPTAVREIPTPISVITSEDIQQQNLRRVDQIFRGMVPGSVAWEGGINDFWSPITVRGATSFGGNSIKTYIDGIEVSDYLYTNVDPASVDHIEVIRGPQASTIYGSDATGGVMQIFTKQGELGSAAPRVNGEISMGGTQSPYVSGATLRQSYRLAVSGGTSQASYNVGGTYERVGAWVPFYRSATPSFFGSGRVVQGPLTIELSARGRTKSFTVTDSPQETALGLTQFTNPLGSPNEVRQQTYGVTLKFDASPRWQHSLTIGVDHLADESHRPHPRYRTPADTFVSVYTSDEGKRAIAYNTSYEIAPSAPLHATITVGIDHFDYDHTSFASSSALNTSGFITVDPSTPAFLSRSTTSNTGMFVQTLISAYEALFLTTGVRAERNSDFGSGLKTAYSPRVGLAYLAGHGRVSVKARASYGESTRPPYPGSKDGVYSDYSVQLANPTLGPERQRGWDAGAELHWRGVGSLSATYYDQLAIDLVDLVLVDGSASPIQYQNQNVGRIRNTGIEFEASLALGPVTIAGQYSTLSSTMRKVGPFYSGDYQIGDRILNVPRVSAGGRITFTPLHTTSVTLSLTHIGSWTAYGSLALDSLYYGGAPYQGPNGYRAYWRTYPGFTKANLSLTQALGPKLSAFLSIENLANRNVVEQADNFPIPGRTTMAGVRFTF